MKLGSLIQRLQQLDPDYEALVYSVMLEDYSEYIQLDIDELNGLLIINCDEELTNQAYEERRDDEK